MITRCLGVIGSTDGGLSFDSLAWPACRLVEALWLTLSTASWAQLTDASTVDVFLETLSFHAAVAAYAALSRDSAIVRQGAALWGVLRVGLHKRNAILQRLLSFALSLPTESISSTSARGGLYAGASTTAVTWWSWTLRALQLRLGRADTSIEVVCIFICLVNNYRCVKS